jgi:hypothetical protein
MTLNVKIELVWTLLTIHSLKIEEFWKAAGKALFTI